MKKILRNVGRLWERYFPHLFTLVSGGIFLHFANNIDFPRGNELYAATLTFFGILMGFLSTSKSILLSIKSPILDKLNKLSKLNELFNFTSHAIWACFSACVLNLLAFFIGKDNLYLQVSWVITTTFAICMFLRITNLVLKILSAHYKENKPSERRKEEPRNIPEDEGSH